MRLHRPTPLALVLIASLTSSNAFAQDAATTQPTAPTTTAPTAEVPVPQPEPGQAVLDVKGLSSIFRLSLQNGFLSLNTELDPQEGSVLVRTPGLPAGGEVTVTASGGAGADNGGLRLVQFTTPPDATPSPLSKTTVVAFPNSVRLNQDSELGPWMRSVQYIQQVPFEPDVYGEPPVKLYVTMTSTVTDEAPVKLNLTARSFLDLRERHPTEVSLYMAPLLVLLQQESILAPDATIARRALLRQETTVDADLTRKVTDLVAKLADNNPTVRSEAYTALDALGEPAANLLANTDRAPLSAEQNATIDALLAARLGAVPGNAKEGAAQPLFLLDCLFLDDAALRSAAFDQLKAQTNLPLEYDANAPIETRRTQSLKVRAQVTTWATSQPTRAN